MKSSGAFVRTGKDDEGFTVSGNKAQRECAKKLILEKVASRVFQAKMYT